MEYNDIRRLVKLVEGSDIEELKIEEKEFKIRITKAQPKVEAAAPIYIPAPSAAPAAIPHQATDFKHVHQEAPVHNIESTESGKENLLEICSPMVGTFYRSSSPEVSPYINEGDTIISGQVLCIIEAMKLMNELEAEISGKIIKILIENGQPVEYNQPIFLVEKG